MKFDVYRRNRFLGDEWLGWIESESEDDARTRAQAKWDDDAACGEEPAWIDVEPAEPDADYSENDEYA